MEREQSSLKQSLIIFLKGVSMGLADIIPGVSGGTIALITGIYERLIFAIKSIDPRLVLYALKLDASKFKKAWKKIDFALLLPLALGITTAFLAAARVIDYALSFYPAFTYAFFFGLILVSAFVVYRRIQKKDHSYRLLMSAGAGFLFAIWLVGIDYLGLIHHPLMIFVSGFIAICAMILPGISGSFILLLLGQYHFLLGELKSLNLPLLTIFIIGACLGLFTFSRVLSYLFKHHEGPTLAFLTGLMLGALRKPLEEVIFVTKIYPGLNFTWSPANITLTIAVGLAGSLLVYLLERNTKEPLPLNLSSSSN